MSFSISTPKSISSRHNFFELNSSQIDSDSRTKYTPIKENQSKLQRVMEQGTIWKKYLLEVEDDEDDGVCSRFSKRELADVSHFFSFQNIQYNDNNSLKAKQPPKERRSIPTQPQISQFQFQDFNQRRKTMNYGEVVENYRTRRDERARRRNERKTRTRISTQINENSFHSTSYQSVCNHKSKYTDEEVDLMKEELLYLRKYFYQLAEAKEKNIKNNENPYETPAKKWL